MSPLEIAANAVVSTAIILAGRNNIHSWWIGIIGSLLFGALFYSVQLYADVTLQIFFVITGIIGWVRWARGGDDGAALPISKSSPLLLALAALVGLIVAIAYGVILDRYTDAYAPFWDSIILVASVIAQFLLMNRKLENWHIWLIVNTIAVPLYISRGLELTGILYAAYWVNALISLRKWRRDMSGNIACSGVAAA